MSGHVETVAGAQPTTWQMYRAMVGVGILCGLLIVTVFQVTLPIIDRNKAEALQAAIFTVLPEAISSRTFKLTDAGAFELLEGEPAGETVVYAGFDGDRLVGLAIEASGMGYADVIRVLYGYSFERDAVVGLQVLESKETPGLGDKIEQDENFLRNFEELKVTLTTDGSQVVNPIAFVKPGEKAEPWQIDGITGATISSTTIADMLRQSTMHWIPKVEAQQGDFRAN